MGFSQGLSGLNASATKLDVIGNNISNSQTVGYKSSNTVFSDIYAGAKVGLGTRVADVVQNFSAGAIEGSSRDLDIAINGQGFLRFEQGDQVQFSRNGQLILDKDGFLTNAQGAVLTGFPGTATGGNPEPIRVPAEGLPATATTEVSAVLNLDAREAIIDPLAAPFDTANPDTYTFSNNVTVFDSLGVSHDMTVYYTKRSDSQWDINTALNGTASATTGQITFNSSGQATSLTNQNFNFILGGLADPLDIELDLLDSTQFGNDFELSEISQDGSTSGSLVGITINKEGNVIGGYSNEESVVLGTIAIANFRNPNGLTPVGENAWVASGDSGLATIGLAGQGLFGSIEPNALEGSNVDLAGELVNMIIAQRNYQANSQTIKTQDEVLQTAINLK